MEEKLEENLKKNDSTIESTTTTSTRSPPWEDLPHHILELFLKSISDPIDRPDLNRVCKAWKEFKLPRSCCFPALVHGPTMCKLIKGGGVDDDEYVLRTCVGSSQGWLIIRMKKRCNHPEERFYLWDLYTKDTIQLPFLWDCYAGDPRISLSSSPTDPDCIVVMFDATLRGFRFSKRGWNKWIKCEYPSYSLFQNHIIFDVFPFQGKLYALTQRGNLVHIDIDIIINVSNPTATPTKLTLLSANSIIPTEGCKNIGREWIQSPKGYQQRNSDWFLTESLGKLLAVGLYRRGKLEEIINLDVLELDFKTMSWIKVKNLPGDQVLFISLFSSFSMSGSEIGIRNCIYISDHVLGKIHMYDMHNQEMIVCTRYPRGTGVDKYNWCFMVLDYRRLWV